MSKSLRVLDSSSPPWLHQPDSNTLSLDIYVQPGAKTSCVEGAHGASLKIRLKAQPIKGKANAELVSFLAEAFAVTEKQVSVIRGETSRHKIVRVIAPLRRPDIDWHEKLQNPETKHNDINSAA